MTKFHEQTVKAMSDAGIAFSATAIGVAGQLSFSIPPSEVRAYITDPKGYIASLYGGTKEQWDEWLDLYGVPRCGALTKSGKLCRASPGGFQLSFGAWLEADRSGYCHVHSR